MSNKDYASHELALKLKACGFDEPCGKGVKIIPGTEREEWDEEECQWCIVRDIEYYPKITLWHAQKWLREVKHISVRVSYIAYHKAWFADWLNLDSGEFDDTDATFATYEEALADGISVALELIEQEKE